MDGPFVPADGAAGWKTSTTPILALAPLAASLAIFDEVGMPALRARSVALTGYLEPRCSTACGVEIVTPRDPAARGAQLSLRFATASSRGRARRPRRTRRRRRLPRAGHHPARRPFPLYTTFHEAWQVAGLVADTMAAVRGAG